MFVGLFAASFYLSLSGERESERSGAYLGRRLAKLGFWLTAAWAVVAIGLLAHWISTWKAGFIFH
jgi:hypothetical protein